MKVGKSPLHKSQWSEISFILFIHSEQQCPGLSVPQSNNGRDQIDTNEDTFLCCIHEIDAEKIS